MTVVCAAVSKAAVEKKIHMPAVNLLVTVGLTLQHGMHRSMIHFLEFYRLRVGSDGNQNSLHGVFSLGLLKQAIF